MSRRTLTAVAAAGAALLVPASPAMAGAALEGGTTTLKLDRATASVLSGAGVSVAPTRPARAARGGVSFPITRGDIHPSTAVGRIFHRGGLRFRAGGESVTLRDFNVRIGRRSTLSARVGRARLPILTLDTSDARVTRAGFATNASRVKAELTGRAAAALNAAFGVSLFRKGIDIGTVTVRSKPAELLFMGGSTNLALDPAAAQALTDLGIQAAPIDPATASGAGLSFPITTGKVNADTLAGQLRHSGGIALTRGGTRVELRSFYINVDGAPDLSAQLGNARAEILNLDVSGLTREVEGRNVTLGNVGATLTAGAAQALNQAFGTDAFKEGFRLGTATVRAEGR